MYELPAVPCCDSIAREWNGVVMSSDSSLEKVACCAFSDCGFVTPATGVTSAGCPIPARPPRSGRAARSFKRLAGGCFSLLLFALLSLATARPVLAVDCSEFPYLGVIDGDVVAAPDQVQID